MIPEIDIWRVATLMLKRYGGEAALESARRADELGDDGDHDGAAVWRASWVRSGNSRTYPARPLALAARRRVAVLR